LENTNIPDDLIKCIEFHGHLCPGLVYGYRVANEAIKRLEINRSEDEEVVCICENDSCSVDAFQHLLGTTAGKGNLIINNFGKNVYTVFSRKSNRAFRFSRIFSYTYRGENEQEFSKLEKAMQEKTATSDDMKRQKHLKSVDLALKSFDEIFNAEEIPFEPPPYAPLAPSVACKLCGELTMETRMVSTNAGEKLCIPCSKSE